MMQRPRLKWDWNHELTETHVILRMFFLPVLRLRYTAICNIYPADFGFGLGFSALSCPTRLYSPGVLIETENRFFRTRYFITPRDPDAFANEVWRRTGRGDRETQSSRPLDDLLKFMKS